MNVDWKDLGRLSTLWRSGSAHDFPQAEIELYWFRLGLLEQRQQERQQWERRGAGKKNPTIPAPGDRRAPLPGTDAEAEKLAPRVPASNGTVVRAWRRRVAQVLPTVQRDRPTRDGAVTPAAGAEGRRSRSGGASSQGLASPLVGRSTCNAPDNSPVDGSQPRTMARMSVDL